MYCTRYWVVPTVSYQLTTFGGYRVYGVCQTHVMTTVMHMDDVTLTDRAAQVIGFCTPHIGSQELGTIKSREEIKPRLCILCFCVEE